MIQEIKTKYKKVENKQAFIYRICEKCGGSPNTKRHHWFADSGFWSIPETHQLTVNGLLDITLEKQNKVSA